jgi:hypothetical protein
VDFMTMRFLGLLLVVFGIVTPTLQACLAQTPQGEYRVSAQRKRSQAPSKGTLLPFFDQTDNPVSVGSPRNRKVDITPLPPTLNEFDQKVLATCGSIGSQVGTIALRRLFSESPDVVRSIKSAVGGEIFAGRRSDTQFRDDLVTIWNDRHAFEHVFCGQIRGSQQIGGLHYVGRYLQLQNEGIAGRLPNNSRAEEVLDGEIYTLGVELRQGNRVIRDSKKGYAYVSNAQDIFVEATQAFKGFANTSTGKQACLYTVQEPDAKQPFKAVFVKTNRAIVTFYPDATPKAGEPECGR